MIYSSFWLDSLVPSKKTKKKKKKEVVCAFLLFDIFFLAYTTLLRALGFALLCFRIYGIKVTWIGLIDVYGFQKWCQVSKR